MVCYCPLSVLSVPESILNEGQLHLAAIFQLSRHHHGDPVVFFFDEPGCKQRGACMRGEQRTESSSGGRGGSPSLPCRQHPASTARAPLICRGVGDQHLHGAVTFTGAGDCSFILLLFSLPYTLLAVMTAILCLTHSSAAAPPRLLEATTNQASPRARSRARNFSIPKILTGN